MEKLFKLRMTQHFTILDITVHWHGR